MDSQSDPLKDLDRNSFFHPFSSLGTHEKNGAEIFVEGQGSTLTDSSGKKYLDAIAGLWCVNIGYGNKEMSQAIADQASKLAYYQTLTSYGTDIAAEYSSRLIELSPVPMSKVFFGSSGSDANDTMVKIVWSYQNYLGKPNKKKIISRHHGYHGSTIFAAGLTGFSNLHNNFDLPLARTLHTKSTHPLWDKLETADTAQFVAELARDLEEMILAEGPETIGAFIAEPIMAGGGVLVPPAGYFAAIQSILKKYEILFIADEVVTGFGRTGKMFGTETFDLKPDLITLAKGITSGYIPLSACLVSEKIWRVLVEGSASAGAYGHGYTYSGHPLAMKAAMVNLDIIERDYLLENVTDKGNKLLTQLKSRLKDHEFVGDIRGFGLLAAVEFVKKRSPLTPFELTTRVGARVARKSFENGLIVRPLSESSTIAFSPTFVVTDSQISEIVDKFAGSVETVFKELHSEGVLKD
jgi:L-2,4-diaminobutyrate transaminase